MAETAGRASRTWIWVVVVVVLAAGIAFLALPSSRDHVVVRSARVERDNMMTTESTNGKVEPLPGLDFQAHAPIASTVEQLNVHLGQDVARGEALLKLDASDAQLRVANAQNLLTVNSEELHNMQSGGTHDELLGERADLANMQTQLQQATTTLSSLQALQRQGAASANEVTAAQQRVSDDQARINQIQTRLKTRYGPTDFAINHSAITRDQQELSAARNSLSGLDVHSPFAGTVYSLPVARYDYVNPGQTLISVADLHRLQVRAYFDEPEIGSLAKGEAVSITWDAKPDRTWHGHVTQAPTTILNVGTRNVGECLISVEDADGQLLPNTNVTVTVVTLVRNNVLTLPREALHTEGADNFVFRIVDGKLARTHVSVGVVNLTRVEVTGGLAPGDLVALTPTTDVDLHNGLAVRTQP